MTATELKARVLAVLDDVATGEEVEITKHGRLVARLVPVVLVVFLAVELPVPVREAPPST
jgi:prevent-host-death family protein